MSGALEAATEHQPAARMALAAALSGTPSHAYLFTGPRGAGKRRAARAFAAEIIAPGCPEPGEARRRLARDPSPHPDLTWLAPRGTRHLVEEVRERVIRSAALRPYEGSRRVFVIEAAEALGEDSQNSLLKTLEEPPPFVHLILLSAEPEGVLETIASRCQRVEFSPLPASVVASGLEGVGEPERIEAAARLAGGDPERARFLLSSEGSALRERAESFAAAALGESAGPGKGGETPWGLLLEPAAEAGERAEAEARVALEREAEEGARRSVREAGEEARRAGRRRRTEVLDLGLELCAGWFRDLVAVASGAEAAVFNTDRMEALRRQAARTDPARTAGALELIADTRRRLDLNVSEELALEALGLRLEALLAAPA
ncbi:MAG: hypothetical protein U0R52_03600 [Solirubrobacterales bacterium]